MSSASFDNIDAKTRRYSMIGLALGMMIACMDSTIVSTCGSTIASDLGGMELYSWMTIAYLLCETSMVPIAGKLSDRYGRKPLFMIGLTLFIIGSIFAGLSSSMIMLIICRAVQGLGGGILMPVAMAAVADFYAPEDRGKMQGMLGAVFGIGTGLGPVVGGLICTYISWHWVFYINVPLAIICLLLTLRKFPAPNVGELKRIDFPGMLVMIAFIVDVLLFFEWLSDDMQITSVKAVAMIVIAIALFWLFFHLERRAEDPVINLRLVKKKPIAIGSAYLFIFGMAFMGVMTYFALYVNNVYDYNTLQCGCCMLPMVAGLMISSFASGSLVRKTGYRIWVIVGSVCVMAGLLLMGTLKSDQNIVLLLIFLTIFGLGLGCSNSTVMISVQNSSPAKDMGMATSTASVMRNIGATVGTAFFALIIAGVMNEQFSLSDFAYLAEEYDVSGTGLLTLKSLGIPGLSDTIVSVFGEGVSVSFFCMGIIFVFGLILALRMAKEYVIDQDEVEE